MDERAKANPNDEKRQEMSIRSVAMEMAIKAGAGSAYDEEGRPICSADKIVDAAKKFEAFIKGAN